LFSYITLYEYISVTTYSLTDHSQSIASIHTTSTESQTGVSSTSLYVSKSTTTSTQQSETTHTTSTSPTSRTEVLKTGIHDIYPLMSMRYVYFHITSATYTTRLVICRIFMVSTQAIEKKWLYTCNT